MELQPSQTIDYILPTFTIVFGRLPFFFVPDERIIFLNGGFKAKKPS